MAERRMFSKTIIDSDLFLDMSLSTQCLYFHLSMRADDDGFVNNPKKIQRMIGAGDDELKMLIVKKFIIPFESGICVIKHWRIHNYIQKDRYHPTLSQNEFAQLVLDKSKNYQLKTEKITMDTNCIQEGYKMDTQSSLGEDRSGEVSLGKVSLSSGKYEDLTDDEDFKEKIKKLEEETLGSFTVYDCKKLLKAAKGDIDLVLHVYENTLSTVSDENPIKNLVAYMLKSIKNEIEER